MGSWSDPEWKREQIEKRIAGGFYDRLSKKFKGRPATRTGPLSEETKVKMSAFASTPEERKRRSESLKGIKRSPETLEKMCAAAKVRDNASVMHTPEARAKTALLLKDGRAAWQTGKKMNAEWCERMRNASIGRKRTPEEIEKSVSKRRGPLHHNWKGGIATANQENRLECMSRYEYRKWRRAVLKRDNHSCVLCGASKAKEPSLELDVDHIKSWRDYPELRLEVSNGRTLCVKCHRQTDTYAGRVFKKNVARAA